MRRLPPLSAVRVFESAARHQNFTAAAAELGMTQAAVSYQIRLLEERLGLPLFSRTKGRVALTEAGRRIAPLLTSAFDTLEDAFSGLVADDQGLLSVSTAQTFAATWLAPRLGAFQVRHADLAVRLSTDNRLVDFSTGEFHAAIRIGRGGWPGLKCHFLLRSHVTPICSAEFQARHRLERPEQLLDVPWLSPSDSWWWEWLREAGVEAEMVESLPGLVLDNQVMEANAAFSGAGIGMMTPMFWRRELAAGRLVQPFAHLHFPGTSHWLVYPEGRRSQPKIAAFREWLLAELREAAKSEPPEVFAEPSFS
ncbi:MAG TPA: LysR substrate-binding domain-containing protein [Allosphingosinicella sp.]|jgi:LysR family glycine cleavage system transcriptional activator|nr:LysR substrate-binding domain-containing protein [Allosphingosinicella sp.]